MPGTQGGDAGYSTLVYAARAIELIGAHPFDSAPLFLYREPHTPCPLRPRHHDGLADSCSRDSPYGL